MPDRTRIRRAIARRAMPFAGLLTAAILTTTLLPAAAEAESSPAPKGKRKANMTPAAPPQARRR